VNQKTAFVKSFCAFALSLLSLPAIQAADITELYVTGGQFHMGFFTPSGPVPFTSTDSSVNMVGTTPNDFPTLLGWDTTQSFTTAQPGSLIAFAFGSPFVNTFVTTCDPQVVDDCVANPHPPSSGTVNGSSTTISDGDNISFSNPGFYANWNGVNFNQGGTSGSGIAYPGQAFEFPYTSTVSNVVSDPINGDTFDYDLTYQSLIVGGPFNGQTGTWRLTGTGRIAVAAGSNVPKTDTGLNLSPNNFATIFITTTDLANASIPLPGSDQDCSPNCWDWVVTGLASPGDSANVVLPLSNGIPADTQFWLYDANTGTWSPFITSGTDSFSTSPTISGLCPDTGDPAYSGNNVLNQGDTCIQITMQDGGVNDQDGAADGKIEDPGGIMVTPPPPPPLTDISDNSSCSLSAYDVDPAKRADWWLLAGFIAWMGWKRRKRSAT